MNRKRIGGCFRTDIIGDKQTLVLINLYTFKERLSAVRYAGQHGKIGIFRIVFRLCPRDLLGAAVDVATRNRTFGNIRRVTVAARSNGYHVDFVFGSLNTGNSVNSAVVCTVGILYDITVAERNALIGRAVKAHRFPGNRERIRSTVTGFILDGKIKQALICAVSNRAPVNDFGTDLIGYLGFLTIPDIHLVFCGIVGSGAHIGNIHPFDAVRGISPAVIPIADICKLNSFM